MERISTAPSFGGFDVVGAVKITVLWCRETGWSGNCLGGACCDGAAVKSLTDILE